MLLHPRKTQKKSPEIMVWGLFPADPRSGEEKYYIYAEGTYKVGRKGCDVIISNDKGVSRIHAEIIVDAMESLEPMENTSSSTSSKVRIRDCSKYGTFIGRTSTVKEKVHDFPGKETYLKNGDLVSFGTGNATYRFSFVPLVFYLCNFSSSQVAPSTQDKVSSIGAQVTQKWTKVCTHVIVDPFMPVTEELVDAIVSKKPLVLSAWLEVVAANRICNEIPGCSSYIPTLTLNGASVTVADTRTRENCLIGYTFVLDSANMYKFRDKMQSLLEVAGAKVLSVEDFHSNSQDLQNTENNRLVLVMPAASAHSFSQQGTLSKVNEISLLSAVISGHLDPSLLISPSIVVSSSCSTDDTIVADSDAETETSEHPTTTNSAVGKAHAEYERKNFGDHAGFPSEGAQITDFKQHNSRTMIREEHKEVTKYESTMEESVNQGASLLGDGQTMNFLEPNGGVRKKEDDPESRNLDILYSQSLIVRDTNPHAATGSITENGVINFKRFRKTNTQSGNSFTNLVLFSKYPYTDSDYDKEISEYVKEEKKRKQMDAMAEDLFTSEKVRRRGVAGSLMGLLSRG